MKRRLAWLFFDPSGTMCNRDLSYRLGFRRYGPVRSWVKMLPGCFIAACLAGPLVLVVLSLVVIANWCANHP